MGQPSPTRRRVPQACDRCRVKKGKCDGKKPLCSRCAIDGQMCMFSERKFSKDRVIPKGYVEMLENRVEILEMGLHEALLRLAGNEGVDVKHSPASNILSPTPDDVLNRFHGLTHNITLALKELEAMKVEREKSLDVVCSPKNGHGDQCDATAGRKIVKPTDATSSTAIDYFGTPSTNPSDSPQPKALFLPTEVTSSQIELYNDSYTSFRDGDLQTLDPLSVISAAGADGTLSSWLDSHAMGAYYGLDPFNDIITFL